MPTATSAPAAAPAPVGLSRQRPGPLRRAWASALRACGLAAALALAVQGQAQAQAQAQAQGPGPAAQRAPAVQALPVAEGTWYVQGVPALGSPANRNFISNAAFVITDDGVLVVDALGAPALAEELLAEIRRLTPLPLRWVVVTHCHADHLYGLQVLRAAGARILAHAACRDYLGSDTAQRRLHDSRLTLAPWVDGQTQLVTPDTWVGERADAPDHLIHLGGRVFRVRHAGPSHTPEDLVVLDEQTGVLFAGDLVFRGRIPFVGQADSGQWVNALDRLLALQPRVLVPGHGPLSLTPREDLQLTRDYLRFLHQAMGDAARRMEPFDEAYARTDWSRFEHLPMFTVANRMNAYNTYLLLERAP